MSISTSQVVAFLESQSQSFSFSAMDEFFMDLAKAGAKFDQTVITWGEYKLGLEPGCVALNPRKQPQTWYFEFQQKGTLLYSLPLTDDQDFSIYELISSFF